jgi:hypothetical protein
LSSPSWPVCRVGDLHQLFMIILGGHRR